MRRRGSTPRLPTIKLGASPPFGQSGKGRPSRGGPRREVKDDGPGPHTTGALVQQGGTKREGRPRGTARVPHVLLNQPRIAAGPARGEARRRPPRRGPGPPRSGRRTR